MGMGIFRLTAVCTSFALVFATAACGEDTDSNTSAGTIAQAESTAGGSPDASTDRVADAESSEELAPIQPEVLETGFASGRAGDAVIVAVIRNPSTTHGGKVAVSGIAYDATGAVVGTTSGSLILRSGETSATAHSLYPVEGTEIAKVAVEAAFTATEIDENPVSRITSRGTRVVADGEPGSYEVDGELVSAYQFDLTKVLTTVVCRNAAGAIAGGRFSYTDLLPGGGTTGVRIPVTAATKPASCQIYANISSL